MEETFENISFFRGNELSSNLDAIYNAVIYKYNNIDDIPWSDFLKQPDVPVRIILWEEKEVIPVDFLFIPRASNNLLVGLHGAESRTQADLPKFQFVRSFMNERTESLIFFSDSTLLLSDKLGLGWMVGNKESHFLVRVINTIHTVINKTGYQKTTLVGHSGGGFAAIAIGSQISNSLAISINGQVLVGAHEPWTVKALQQQVFPEELVTSAMISKYPERMDLRNILERRVENSTFAYFAHKGDPNTYFEYPHFKLLADSMKVSHQGGVNKNGDKLVLCNWDILGSSAHSLPGTVIPFIQFALGEEPKIDIKPITPII